MYTKELQNVYIYGKIKEKGGFYMTVNDLVIGKKYKLDTGFWGVITLLYCGPVKEGKRIKYRFTFGNTVESWAYNFNFVACKSKFKILMEV